MTRNLRLSLALLAVALFLTACPSNPASNVAITAASADAVAYSADGGDWQVPDNPDEFTIAARSSYQVAVRCGDSTNIYAFAVSDATAVDFSCAPEKITYTVTYDATQVTGADHVMLFAQQTSALGSGNTGQIAVTSGVAGTQDLVLVVYDGTGAAIAARMETLDVSDGGSYSITVESGDTGHLRGGGSVSDFSSQVPAGWTSSSGFVVAMTPLGTQVILDFILSSGGSYTSFDFAKHDAVMVSVKDQSPNPSKTLAQLLTSHAPAASFEVQLPEVFDATVSHEALPEFSNLNRASSDLVGYHLQIEWGTQTISALVSKAFLGSSASYRIPDLTGVSGFSGAKPASGETVKATAETLESNADWKDVLKKPLHGMPLDLPDLNVKIAGDIEEYVAP